MRNLTTYTLVALVSLLLTKSASAHCQVPCGIYGDQRRFEAMLEDAKTIARGMTQINELASKKDGLSGNQLARWVMTKEDHASNTQKIIAEYFMTQRIKPDAPNYVRKLTAAHGVMVAAMKCKQTVDTKNADALRTAIYKFYEAYEGKKPNFE